MAAANAGEREAGRFSRLNDAFVAALMKMQRLSYLAGGLPGILLSASTAVVFLYGGSRVIDGVMTLGTFTAFMAYQMRLIGPVQGLMGLYTGLGAARVSLKRVHEILDEPVEVVDPAAPVPLGRVRGEIVFEDVSCGHGRGADVLDRAARAGGGGGAGHLRLQHLDPGERALRAAGRWRRSRVTGGGTRGVGGLRRIAPGRARHDGG